MEAEMSVFKRKTKRGETEFYHYRFKLAGKLYYGVCDGCEQKRDADAFEKEMKQSVFEAEGIARRGKKTFLEAFKEELSGGNPVPVVKAWGLFEKKPHEMGQRHQEMVKGRWLDFVSFMQDNYPDTVFLDKITKGIAEEYIQHIRKKGPWTNSKFNLIARFLDVSTGTIKKYSLDPDFPHTKNLIDFDEWFKDKNKVLSKTQKRKRATYKESTGTKLSTETQNNYLTTCNMVINGLAEQAGVIENPFVHIKKLTNKPVEREAFTPEELKLIADSSKGTWIYTLFITGVNTGLREGDICTLLWREVDLESGWIERTMRKTGKPVKIPILPALNKYLKALPKEDKYCFPELAEMYLGSGRTTIGHSASKFLTQLGIETNRKLADRSRMVSVKDIHSCRHTFAYLAAINGVPFPIVQSVVGHMSPEMTKKYIDHASEQEKRKAFDLIPDYMGILEDNVSGSDLTADQKINEAISFLKSKKKLSDSDKRLLEILGQIR